MTAFDNFLKVVQKDKNYSWYRYVYSKLSLSKVLLSVLSRSFLKMLRHVYSAIGARFCDCWSLKMAPSLWFSSSSIKVMLVGQRMKFPLRQGWGGHPLWHTYIEWRHTFQSSKQKCTSSLNRKLSQKAWLSCPHMSQVYIGLALILLALWKVLFEQNSKSCHSSSTSPRAISKRAFLSPSKISYKHFLSSFYEYMVNKGKSNKEEAYLKFSATFKMRICLFSWFGLFFFNTNIQFPYCSFKKCSQRRANIKKDFLVMNHILCLERNIILRSIN